MTPLRLVFQRWLAPAVAAALLPLCLGAQSHPPSLANPAPTVHELAQRIDKHYNQLHSLKAGFTESY